MKRAIVLILAAGLVVTACAGGDSGDEAAATSADDDSGGGEVASETPVSEEGTDVRVDLDVGEGRQVIRRASLELRASDTRRTFDDIVAMVESAGGFVADATVHPTAGEDRQPEVSMTVRVPADQLNATMSAIKDSVDEVVSESQSAEDVTEQYIDLEARLTNLEALETELRALLQEVRMQENADPEKILRVFNELSSTRGQIEQIQGQLNYLDDHTSLATLDIQLTQTPSAVPIVDEPWSPADAGRDALRSLVTGLQGATDWAINFALYALPMLIVTLGPLALIVLFVYRRWFRKEKVTPAPAES